MLIVVSVFFYLAYAVTIATIIVVLALVLRMVLQWLQVNPFGWFVANLRRATEPVMRPFRYGFDHRTLRFDMMPLVAAALVLINGLFMAWIIGEIGTSLMIAFLGPSITVGRILGALVWIVVVAYMALLLMRFLLPMLGIGYSSGFLRVAYRLTEPVLKPLRKYLIFGALDLSPIVVIFVVQFVGMLLRDALIRM